MANQDYAQTVRDMMGGLDASAMENFAKSQSALAEKMAAVAIDAARQSTELAAKWTQDALTKVGDATRARPEPADYTKAATELMSASAQSATEHLAGFAEIARRVQSETLELFLAAGRDMGEDVQAAARKAGADMTAAAQRLQSNATNV